MRHRLVGDGQEARVVVELDVTRKGGVAREDDGRLAAGGQIGVAQ